MIIKLSFDSNIFHDKCNCFFATQSTRCEMETFMQRKKITGETRSTILIHFYSHLHPTQCLSCTYTIWWCYLCAIRRCREDTQTWKQHFHSHSNYMHRPEHQTQISAKKDVWPDPVSTDKFGGKNACCLTIHTTEPPTISEIWASNSVTRSLAWANKAVKSFSCLPITMIIIVKHSYKCIRRYSSGKCSTFSHATDAEAQASDNITEQEREQKNNESLRKIYRKMCFCSRECDKSKNHRREKKQKQTAKKKKNETKILTKSTWKTESLLFEHIKHKRYCLVYAINILFSTDRPIGLQWPCRIPFLSAIIIWIGSACAWNAAGKPLQWRCNRRWSQRITYGLHTRIARRTHCMTSGG